MPRFSSSTTPTRSLVSPGLVLPVACFFGLAAMRASFDERTDRMEEKCSASPRNGDALHGTYGPACALHSLLGIILDRGHEKVAGSAASDRLARAGHSRRATNFCTRCPDTSAT